MKYVKGPFDISDNEWEESNISLFWGHAFHSSTGATCSSARSLVGGEQSSSPCFSCSQTCSMGGSGCCWPHEELRLPEVELFWHNVEEFYHPSTEHWECAVELGANDGFYEVSGRSTYNNHFGLVLTRGVCPDCCASSTKAKPGEHDGLGVLFS